MNNQVAQVSKKELATAEPMVPAGYKQTEVGVIPEDWELKTIGELATVFSGGTPNRKMTEYWGGDIPWVTTTLIDGQVINSANEFITDKGVDSSSAKWCKAGSILMAMYGQGKTRGKAALLGFDATINQACAAIELKDVSSSAYILHTLNSMYEEIRELSNSGGQENLSGGIVKNIIVPLPPKKEQTAIANALSDVDALIGSLEALVAKKQAIKTATMQQLLTGRTRLPQFATHPDGSPKGYKASELGEIPEDWDAIKMGDLAKIQRGASPRPIDSPIWFERNSTVGWLRISDVSKTNKYLMETTQSLSELGISNSRFVPKNNLVMSICATVGKPIITKKDLCIHDGFVVFHGLSVNQDYMYYILKELEDEWGKQGQTGSQMNLNTDLINGTYVAIPKIETEQTAIATILSDMDEEIQALEARLTKTRDLKQGMMQQLLTGKIRLVKPLAGDEHHAG